MLFEGLVYAPSGLCSGFLAYASLVAAEQLNEPVCGVLCTFSGFANSLKEKIKPRFPFPCSPNAVQEVVISLAVLLEEKD